MSEHRDPCLGCKLKLTNNKVHSLQLAPIALAILTAIGTQPTEAAPEVIQIQAKCYQYSPREIHLIKGVPVVLQITTLDKAHGFYVPDMNIDATAKPGKPAQVGVTPTKSGVFPFSCDVFCGTGHDDMEGKFIVTDK
jgi:cytochrome c oxidase subunit 2